MLLFCYGSLKQEQHARNPKALRPEIPTLFELVRWIRGGRIRGIPAIKPPSSQPAKGEEYVFDWIGMLGLPLVPMHTLPQTAPALVVTSHLRHDPGWRPLLQGHLRAGKPVLATKAFVEEVKELARSIEGGLDGVHALTWGGDIRGIMDLPPERLSLLRNPLLEPLGLKLEAPGRVALYLPAENVIALENFADVPASVTLLDTERTLRVDGTLVLPPQTEVSIQVTGHRIEGTIPPRTLLVWRLTSESDEQPR
jgi:hypothetical protein